MSRSYTRALIRLLSSPDNPRTATIRSGYRSLLRIEGLPLHFGFELVLDDGALAPGEEALGTLSFWAVEDLPPLLRGTRFDVIEGPRVVARGELLGESTSSKA